MQHGFLLLWDWLLSPEHVVHYYHLSHELWNDISYSADNFQDLLQDRNWFSVVAKEVYVPGVMPGMLSDSVAMDSFLLLEQSSVVMSEVFWLLLQGFEFYFVCCSWVCVFVSCRSMLDAVNCCSWSPWVWLDVCCIWRRFSKGWCFFGYPEPPKSIAVLPSVEFLWGSKMQHLELWVCFVY